jgi:hypothetical protein
MGSVSFSVAEQEVPLLVILQFHSEMYEFRYLTLVFSFSAI